VAVTEILEAFFETVELEVLEEGNDIRITNFGSFRRRHNAARAGRNPKTGEALMIPARTTLAFTASSSMKTIDDGNDDDA
jgi:DNA-binding protein HU-beta